MIPLSGRCTVRQYVKNKPRPVGLKNFVVTTSGGLVMDFEIYQGKTTSLVHPELGLGPSVVLRLVNSLPKNAFVYFDRYFTTIALLEKLQEIGLEGTGTIMSNRLKNVHFATNKRDRGDIQEFVRSDGNIVAVQWQDSQKVLLVSTAVGKEPVAHVERWAKKESKYIKVSCPSIVQMYNRFMGGVDVCDQQLEAYRTWFKTRKWTLKTILHFFDLAIVNSWFEYRIDCQSNAVEAKHIMDLLKFRLAISEALTSTPKRKRLPDDSDDEKDKREVEDKKTSVQPLPAINKRTDGYDHWPTSDDISAPRCCRLEECKSRSKVRCTKCNIYLCMSKGKDCFRIFHQP